MKSFFVLWDTVKDAPSRGTRRFKLWTTPQEAGTAWTKTEELREVVVIPKARYDSLMKVMGSFLQEAHQTAVNELVDELKAEDPELFIG